MVVVIATLTAPGRAAAPPNPGPWTTLAKLDRGQAPAVSCATPQWCWAIGGGQLLQSTDAGASWVERSDRLPAQVAGVDALDCPVAGLCYVAGRLEAGGNAVVALTPDTTTATPAPGRFPVRAIACASARRCMAVLNDSRVVATTSAGARWSGRGPAFDWPVFGITCVADTSTCVLTGSDSFPFVAKVVRTTDLGVTWTEQTPPSELRALGGVDCTSELACVAGGRSSSDKAAVAATVDGGTTWTLRTVPEASVTSPRSVGLSCPTSETCTAFWEYYDVPVALRSTDGGLTWARQSLPLSSAGHTELSCPTEDLCAAMGRVRGGFAYDAASGAGWQLVPVAPSYGTLDALSCPSEAHCVGAARNAVFGTTVVTSDDGGRTWTRSPLPNGAGRVWSLDCTTPADCQAWAYTSRRSGSGYVGRSLRSVDGGRTWRLRSGTEVREPGMADLSCRDALTCVAVGSGRRNQPPQVRTTLDGGQTWQAPAAPPDAASLYAVACGRAACVLLGYAGPVGDRRPTAWHTTDLGASYLARPLPAGAGYDDVDCFGSLCAVVGSGGPGPLTGRVLTSRNGGRVWTAVALPAGTGALREVSCARDGCAIAGHDQRDGDDGGVLVSGDRGLTFAFADVPPSLGAWSASIACAPSGSRCVASDVSPAGYPRVIGSP